MGGLYLRIMFSDRSQARPFDAGWKGGDGGALGDRSATDSVNRKTAPRGAPQRKRRSAKRKLRQMSFVRAVVPPSLAFAQGGVGLPVGSSLRPESRTLFEQPLVVADRRFARLEIVVARKPVVRPPAGGEDVLGPPSGPDDVGRHGEVMLARGVLRLADGRLAVGERPAAGRP